MRAPEKIAGSAPGSSTRRKIASRPPCSVRIIRTSSGSAERRPSTALTTIGKKQTIATTTSFGVDAVAEQDGEHRCEQHGRHRLREDEDRQQRAPERGREVEQDGERERDRDREQVAEHDLAHRHERHPRLPPA